VSQGRALRFRDVAASLRVSQQRGAQMYAEGKLPKPDQIDGIGPHWKPATIERWAERQLWGNAALEEAPRQSVGGGKKERWRDRRRGR
jgi:predicted DNA-binding transcriptional regulator AlpA